MGRVSEGDFVFYCVKLLRDSQGRCDEGSRFLANVGKTRGEAAASGAKVRLWMCWWHGAGVGTGRFCVTGEDGG